MKALRLALCATLCLVAAPMSVRSADAQVAEWRGFGYVGNFTANCAPDWGGTWQVNARYRPANLGSNGPNTRLSFFSPFYAMNFTREGGRFTPTYRNIQSAGLGASGRVIEGSRIQVTTMVPNNANLNPNSPTVRLVGDIRNFDGIQGCTASFEVTMLLRQ